MDSTTARRLDEVLYEAKARESESLLNYFLYELWRVNGDRILRRYSGRHHLIGEHEIESEYLLGSYKGSLKADVTRGSPSRFVSWCGQKAVAASFQQTLKGVRCVCGGAVRWQRGRVHCRECGSHSVEFRPTEESVADPDGASEGSWDVLMLQIELEDAREKLSGRVRELFDLIVYEGYSPGSGPDNYLDEISQMWGISRSSVKTYLRRLRSNLVSMGVTCPDR